MSGSILLHHSEFDSTMLTNAFKIAPSLMCELESHAVAGKSLHHQLTAEDTDIVTSPPDPPSFLGRLHARFGRIQPPTALHLHSSGRITTISRYHLTLPTHPSEPPQLVLKSVSRHSKCFAFTSGGGYGMIMTYNPERHGPGRVLIQQVDRNESSEPIELPILDSEGPLPWVVWMAHSGTVFVVDQSKLVVSRFLESHFHFIPVKCAF
ncbi:hypothetical protein B0H19DRAFT_1257820 [Mycena capillaripes]|nr:hypothetical protein B0H19DRAFT_1257820 [Mycena capillaripes]